MGKAYKNFWSLNTDEAVVAGILRDEMPKKEIEVLMPLNAQMKDIDLVLFNVKNRKSCTIQVKGSRAYEPQKKETERYHDGSAAWFFFPRSNIDKSTADYFVFLIYVLERSSKTGRMSIEPHTITIPTEELKEIVKLHKEPHGKDRYCFFFWVNPKEGRAFDFREDRKKPYAYDDYLDEKGFAGLAEFLD